MFYHKQIDMDALVKDLPEDLKADLAAFQIEISMSVLMEISELRERGEKISEPKGRGLKYSYTLSQIFTELASNSLGESLPKDELLKKLVCKKVSEFTTKKASPKSGEPKLGVSDTGEVYKTAERLAKSGDGNDRRYNLKLDTQLQEYIKTFKVLAMISEKKSLNTQVAIRTLISVGFKVLKTEIQSGATDWRAWIGE
jgi:hypothetical protein